MFHMQQHCGCISAEFAERWTVILTVAADTHKQLSSSCYKMAYIPHSRTDFLHGFCFASQAQLLMLADHRMALLQYDAGQITAETYNLIKALQTKASDASCFGH